MVGPTYLICVLCFFDRYLKSWNSTYDPINTMNDKQLYYCIDTTKSITSGVESMHAFKFYITTCSCKVCAHERSLEVLRFIPTSSSGDMVSFFQKLFRNSMPIKIVGSRVRLRKSTWQDDTRTPLSMRYSNITKLVHVYWIIIIITVD